MAELDIVYFFNHLGRGTVIDKLSEIVSSIYFLGPVFLLIAVLFLVLDKKRGKWIFLGTLVLLAIYLLVNDQIIKYAILEPIFFRQRPYLAHPNEILATTEHWTDSSFPSGHMVITFAYVTYFLFLLRRWWTWGLGLILVLFVAFTRLHNGMHYPSDILAGSFLGLIYAGVTIYLFKKRLNTRSS